MARFGSPNPQVRDQSSVAVVPQVDLPRATFNRGSKYLTTFDSDKLIPIHWDEVLPGDTIKLKVRSLVRMNGLLRPLMDDISLSTHIFFVPTRLTDKNWERLLGERPNPNDSIDFATPKLNFGDTTIKSHGTSGRTSTDELLDYFGLPTGVQFTPNDVIAGPLRCYNFIWNEWYRDQDLQ